MTPTSVLLGVLLALPARALGASGPPQKPSLGRRHHERATSTPLPDYALTHAPYSYLHSAERTFPSDITVHLNNTIPETANRTALGPVGSVTIDTLDSYASDVYLTSADKVSGNPAWLLSDYGIPQIDGYSAAPGLIIAAEKNETTTDVFYFNFYSYNWARP